MVIENRALVNADAKATRRPVADPRLPAGLMWQTTRVGNALEGRYLVRAPSSESAHSWNNGRVIRFDKEEVAKYMQKSLHLENDTVIEKTYAISGRCGHRLKWQFAIRRVYAITSRESNARMKGAEDELVR